MASLPDWSELSDPQAQRWTEMLGGLAELLAPGPRLVVVDGTGDTGSFADRLAAALIALGHATTRLGSDAEPSLARDTIVVADGTHWRAHPPGPAWDVVVALRAERSAGRDGHIVVDIGDPTWPVVRHVDMALGEPRSWHLTETRAFFAVRASTWDDRFGDDRPAYARAVTEVGVPAGGTAIDVGCGTGRALPALRDTVGPAGRVVGFDLTPQMLLAAREHGRAELAGLAVADALHLPVRDACVDTVFAAGLIGHLPDVEPGLTELARVTVDGGRLALFHPSGRVRLAARHGRALRDDEPLSPGPLPAVLARAGWALTSYDDADDRFLAIATRAARTSV